MKKIDEGIVFDAAAADDSRQVCAFTSLTTLRSGRLLATFRVGSSKNSTDGNCLIMSSDDRGLTWQPLCDGFETTLDGVNGEIRSAELGECDDGSLIAVLAWVDCHAGGGSLIDTESDQLIPMHLLLARSTDGGRSWTDGGVLRRDAVLSGPLVRIADANWLTTWEFSYGPEKGWPARTHGVYGSVAADDCSFAREVEVAPRQAPLFFYDQRQQYCPWRNRLVAMFWTYNGEIERDEPIHMAWGDPQTLTWETPFSTHIQGQIARPIPLADGRLLAFYVHRHQPGSMRLVASRDDGKTWELENELVIYHNVAGPQEGADNDADFHEFWDAMSTWCFGHPAAALLDDGSLLLLYYAGPHDKCLSIHWARVEI